MQLPPRPPQKNLSKSLLVADLVMQKGEMSYIFIFTFQMCFPQDFAFFLTAKETTYMGMLLAPKLEVTNSPVDAYDLIS